MHGTIEINRVTVRVMGRTRLSTVPEARYYGAALQTNSLVTPD